MENRNKINEIKDYADCADASYAMLDFVFDFNKWDKPSEADKITFGNENMGKINNAYARCIEARFMQDKTIKKGIFTTIINNNPKNVLATDTLSQRTINFVNSFKLLAHQPNTDSGFSATLFDDTKNANQKIFAIRGTETNSLEQVFNDLIIADGSLLFHSKPKSQYFDMMRFYNHCINKKYITNETPLIVVGHSLGGALAQLFALSFATDKDSSIIKEIYTFNAPGAKTLKVPYRLNPIPHYIVLLTKDDLSDKQSLHFKIEKSLQEYNNIFMKYEAHDKIMQTFKRELRYNLLKQAYNLIHTNGNKHYLGIYFDPLNGLMPYVYHIKKPQEYEYYYLLNFYHHLYQNHKKQKPLASKKNTYHIETTHDNENIDSILDYPHNAIQHLWTKIDGYRHILNVGVTGFKSHFMKYSARVLYFYSYLLSLSANDEMIKSKLKATDKQEQLNEYLNQLNIFMSNIKIAMDILINELNKQSHKIYNKSFFKTKPDSIDYLALLCYQINEKAYKIQSISQDKKKCFKTDISEEEIIDFVLKLQEANYFIKIIDNESLKDIRNTCKLSLATCQPFIFVDSTNNALIDSNNVNAIFGYLGLGDLLTQEWHEEYINGMYHKMKGVYFGGNAYSNFSKYANKQKP